MEADPRDCKEYAGTTTGSGGPRVADEGMTSVSPAEIVQGAVRWVQERLPGFDAAEGGQVPYGASDLSQAVIGSRVEQDITTPRNGAAFEYEIGGELRVEVRFSVQNVGHAERRAWNSLAERGITPGQVTRIYSELEPCSYPGRNCAAWIARTFPNAQVTWSFEYGDSASRIAGVRALARVT